jgi:hypothetical protein
LNPSIAAHHGGILHSGRRKRKSRAFAVAESRVVAQVDGEDTAGTPPAVCTAANGRSGRSDGNGKVAMNCWPDYPWTRGSRSYWKVGEYTTFAGIEGCRQGNCHFAGEHTSLDSQG